MLSDYMCYVICQRLLIYNYKGGILHKMQSRYVDKTNQYGHTLAEEATTRK